MWDDDDPYQAALDALDGDDWEEERGKLTRKKASITEEAMRARAQRTRDRQILRRAASEQRLRDVLDWHLEEGCAYHVLTGGDVDFLSFVRCVVEAQPLDYLMLSTWVMAKEDAEELSDWLAKGYVKRIDVYAGERSIEHYAQVWDSLERTVPMYGGRLVTSKNHAKVALMYGRDYTAVLESSANINTNPRTEQSCITVSKELADFYKAQFDQMTSIRPWPYPWTPWEGSRWPTRSENYRKTEST